MKQVQGDRLPVLRFADTGTESTCGSVPVSNAAVLCIGKWARVNPKNPDQEDKNVCNRGAGN